METQYVVQGFFGAGQGMVACKPILHAMEPLARSCGEVLAGQCDGVLVYAQDADFDRGEYSTPVILARYGAVPHPEILGLRQRVPEPAQEHETWWRLPRNSGDHAQAL